MTGADEDGVEVMVLDVLRISVDGDGRREAQIFLRLDIGEDLHLKFLPVVLAKLEAMLAQAAIEQAKVHPRQ